MSQLTFVVYCASIVIRQYNADIAENSILALFNDTAAAKQVAMAGNSNEFDTGNWTMHRYWIITCVVLM